MGCCVSAPSEARTPWERETQQVRLLAEKHGVTDSHAIALLCEAHKLRFVDLEFPPCDDSDKNTKGVEWRRPHDFLSAEDAAKATLYDQTIVPNDVCQGGLGDCWLICVFAILAQYPALVRRIMPVQYSDLQQGVFRLRICKDGWWTWHLVDSFFPASQHGLHYGSCRSSNELWVPVMEKAYAKLFGSYEGIVGGWPPSALENFTGCSTTTWESKDDTTFGALQTAFDRGFLATTWTEGKDCSDYVKDSSSAEEMQYFKMCEKMGIVAGHAYSVMRVAQYRDRRLIKLRNPWGGHEWKGAWGDTSPEMDSDARISLQHEDSDDGSFWMLYDDFKKFFPGVSICKLRMEGITGVDWTDIRSRGFIFQGKPNHLVKIHVREDSDFELRVFNQSYRRDTDPMAKLHTSLSLVLFRASQDGKTYYRVSGDIDSTRLSASEHPYLLVPYSYSELRKEQELLPYTILVNSQSSQTVVETCIALPGLLSHAKDGTREFSAADAAMAYQMNVPMQRNGLQPPSVNWRSSLVQLPGDGECGVACASLLVPFCVSPWLRTRYDNSSFLLNFFCLTMPLMRNIVRQGYNVEGSCVSDVFASICCYPCSLMQVYREVTHPQHAAEIAMGDRDQRPWKNGCCSVGRFDKDCLLSCFCPPIANAMSRSQFDGSNCLFNFFCMCGPMARNIVREGYHLEGNCLSDIICSTVFAPCSANQLRREVNDRGPKSMVDVVQVYLPPVDVHGPTTVAAVH